MISVPTWLFVLLIIFGVVGLVVVCFTIISIAMYVHEDVTSTRENERENNKNVIG